MPFRKIDILKAFGITHIFETSKAVGKTDAFAVLSDGAGISYGFSQFTHRSGSLKKVCTEYLRLGGTVGADVIKACLPNLANAAFITKYSKDVGLKIALLAAGKTDLMRQAQEHVAVKYYMQPSINACDGSGFVLPLSLAVVYDANNQGGYAAVRDRVSVKRSDFTSALAFEKAWITSFCIKRKTWLVTRPKAIVHATVYRPEFFLAQISASNWNLNFPMTVHGHKFTTNDLPETEDSNSAAPTNGPEPPPLDSNLGQQAAEDIKADGAKDETPPPPTQQADQIINAGNVTGEVEDKPFQQYIPDDNKIRVFFRNILSGQLVANIGVWFSDLPLALKILLAVVLGASVLLFLFYLIKNREWLMSFVKQAMGHKADPTQNSPVLTTEKPTDAESIPTALLRRVLRRDLEEVHEDPAKAKEVRII